MKCARLLVLLSLLGTAAALGWAADETSSGDKLRILYSNHFHFADDGSPVMTVEIMGGQNEIRLSTAGGIDVLPDGEGGAEVRGGTEWTITAEGTEPAVIREWVVAERLGPDDEAGTDRALETWRKRGHRVESFEIGTVFGVGGEVIDSREVLIALDPSPAGNGQRRAREIETRYKVATTIHSELVRRARGTVIARSGKTVIRNPSVLWFAPRRRDQTLDVADVEVGGGGSQLETRREHRRFFGLVYVTLGSDGKLTAVNAVPVDKLLAGLVPSEIFPEAPDDALAAQAIAARTELLQKIGTRHLADPFRVCSTQHCQVYSGAGKEHPRTTRAVEKTRGLVLIRKGGGLVDARYSASCGGHGEHNENIWGGAPDPSLRGALDAPAGSPLARRFGDGVSESEVEKFLSQKSGAYCSATRYAEGRFRWKQTLAASEIDALVASAHPEVGHVIAIEPLERGVSGRIKRVRIRGDQGSAEVSGDLAIRRMLGGLKSALFTVQTRGPRARPSEFEFLGAGFGHGVGMCQVGAISMAESRNTFREILHHYYPGSTLHRLY